MKCHRRGRESTLKHSPPISSASDAVPRGGLQYVRNYCHALSLPAWPLIRRGRSRKPWRCGAACARRAGGTSQMTCCQVDLERRPEPHDSACRREISAAHRDRSTSTKSWAARLLRSFQLSRRPNSSGGQPQGRQGARPHDPAGAAAASGSGDRVAESRSWPFLCGRVRMSQKIEQPAFVAVRTGTPTLVLHPAVVDDRHPEERGTEPETPETQHEDDPGGQFQEATA
jgi:hypothetical protein